MSSCSGGEDGRTYCGSCPACVTLGREGPEGKYQKDSLKRLIELRAEEEKKSAPNLAKVVEALKAENAKLKILIDVAYDERDHWHRWARRAMFFANAWKRVAKKLYKPSDTPVAPKEGPAYPDSNF